MKRLTQFFHITPVLHGAFLLNCRSLAAVAVVVAVLGLWGTAEPLLADETNPANAASADSSAEGTSEAEESSTGESSPENPAATEEEPLRLLESSEADTSLEFRAKKPTPKPKTPAKSQTAPGQSRTVPAKSQTAPGQSAPAPTQESPKAKPADAASEPDSPLLSLPELKQEETPDLSEGTEVSGASDSSGASDQSETSSQSETSGQPGEAKPADRSQDKNAQSGTSRKPAKGKKKASTELPELPALDPSMDIGDVSNLEKTMTADENASDDAETETPENPEAAQQPEAETATVGTRPYELVWAKRFSDTNPPLFHMSQTSGWQTRTRQGAVAQCELTSEQQVFSPQSLKVTYRAVPAVARQWKIPSIQVSLEMPIQLHQLSQGILSEGSATPLPGSSDAQSAPTMDMKDIMKSAMEDAKSDLSPAESSENSKTASQPIESIKTGMPKNPDTISCWIYGSPKSHQLYEESPDVYAVFKSASDQVLEVFLASVSWSEWSMAYAPLSYQEQKFLSEKGVKFFGFRIKNATNTEERSIFFDSLCLFRENRVGRLQTSRRPRRGISLADGRSIGQNSGEGRLAFPVNGRTITPSISNTQALNKLMRSDTGVFALTYDGIDGLLSFFYTPQTGTWSDFKARWNNGTLFSPLEGGGVRTLIDNSGKEVPVARVQHIRTEIAKDNTAIITQWRLSTLPSSDSPAVTAVVQYRFRMLGKTLMIDTTCRGGRVADLQFGALRNDNFEYLQVLTLPYLTYSNHEDSRPGIVMMNDLFISGFPDWYVSNASQFYGKHSISSSLIYYSGGSRYLPKTDGARNDCYDRFFVTIGPKLVDVMPNVSNPASVWQNTMSDGLWWHSNPTMERNREKNVLRNLWRYGMLRLNILEGRESWRDGHESFSFRTLPAPKKGGDKALINQTKFLQEKLKYRFVSYCNFMDISPVNEFWTLDMLSRASTGSLQSTVAGNYAFKPAYAIDKHEQITKMNHLKYRTSAGFCDGITSFAPWERTDYDSRVSGGGTFAAIFYLYGELLQNQKKAWEGPIVSSGGCHWLYGGLCDGSMAIDSMYNWQTQPWIPDFDLQKLHSLESDIGMGTIEQFYADSESALKLLSEKFLDPRLDVLVSTKGKDSKAASQATPENAPATPEATPASPATTPAGTEATPANPTATPAGTETTPANPVATPVGTEVTPAVPTPANPTPAVPVTVPAGSEATPANSEVPSADFQSAPVDSGTTASNADLEPANSEVANSEVASMEPEPAVSASTVLIQGDAEITAKPEPAIGTRADSEASANAETGAEPDTNGNTAASSGVPADAATSAGAESSEDTTEPDAATAASATAETAKDASGDARKTDDPTGEAAEKPTFPVFKPAKPIFPNEARPEVVRNAAWQKEQLKDALCDRYTAATMAFGHVGYLLLDYGLERAWRSYFLLQQLQRHYVPAKLFEVAYFDENGHQIDASTALQEGYAERNHLLIRYHNGTTLFVNGSETETLRTTFGRQYIELPPGGFWGMTGDDQIESFSGNVYEDSRFPHRVDYAVSPSYLFIDGRGSFVYFPKACGNGPGLCRRLNANTYEIITLNGAECGFDIPAVKATAYDFQGRAIGPAKIRLSRNYVFVEPVEGAFSYILRTEIQALDMPTHVLSCAQTYGKPGEQITVNGKYDYTIEIPPEAKPGERFWYNIDDDWIEFTAESLCEVTPQVHGSKLEVTLAPRVSMERKSVTMRLKYGGLEQVQSAYRLENGVTTLQFDLSKLRTIGLTKLDYQVEIDDQTQEGQIILNITTPNKSYPLDIVEKSLAHETEQAKTAVDMNLTHVQLADGTQTPYFSLTKTKASVEQTMLSCGKVEKLGVFVKPLQRQKSNSFAIENTIHIPDERIEVVLRADVGKWDGCASGTTVNYRIDLVASNGRRFTLAEHEQVQYGWSHMEADLSQWRGQDVTLQLVTNVKNSATSSTLDAIRSNVGCWANVRMESKKKVYIRKVLSSTP